MSHLTLVGREEAVTYAPDVGPHSGDIELPVPDSPVDVSLLTYAVRGVCEWPAGNGEVEFAK